MSKDGVIVICDHCDGTRLNAWTDIRGFAQFQCRDCGNMWSIPSRAEIERMARYHRK